MRSRAPSSHRIGAGPVRTLYTPPKKGQKTAALHVVGRADLPDCAKRVFSALVWHANQTDGRCDPSHELLLHGSELKSPTSVSKGLAALRRANFILEVRKARPHHSAGYQINWPLLSELQRRWEEKYAAVMVDRRRTRDSSLKTGKAPLRTFKPSDTVPGRRNARRLVYPHDLGGNDAMSVVGIVLPNSTTGVGVNSLEPCENNSVGREKASPERRASSLHTDPYHPNRKRVLQMERMPDPLLTVEEDLRVQAPNLYGEVVEWVPDALIQSALAAERERPHSGALLILGAYQNRGDHATSGFCLSDK